MTYDFGHWGELPMVSGQCITYGRTSLLDEAVESFLRQDYPGKKELVIVNDHVMKIEFSHPEVRVVNVRTRFPTVGEKRNYCCALCKGSVIFPWDDDDISLSHRISYSLQQMRNHMYYKPDSFWTWGNGVIKPEPSRNVAHAMGCFSHAWFDELGGYPKIQSGQDMALENLFKGPNRVVEKIAADKIYYIYRFAGTHSYHLSCYGYGKGFDESKKYVDKVKLPATHVISPKWSQDYPKMVAEILAKRKK